MTTPRKFTAAELAKIFDVRAKTLQRWLESGEFPLLLTVNQAAKLLGLSSKTVRTWGNAGELPVVRLGRSVRIRADRLRQWLAAAEERDARTTAARDEAKRRWGKRA